ncbi:hypothetical protein B2J93_1280 [Marssonina coronariae]|uniref:Glycoside hydrolase family 31 TIM barrel domain-containing protein n=1 Tax=Diplocarpon coronariae TaxID=2795749 RepID=A0A218Z2X3_9HELO|nr:hypothetical protein B2J93_1280 [Marssonina coronariae]
MNAMPTDNRALQKPTTTAPRFSVGEQEAKIIKGRISAVVSKRGKIMIYNSEGDLLLEEYARNRIDVTDPKCSAIKIQTRESKPIFGADYHLTMRLESVSLREKTYRRGQYQQDSLDLKGHDLELAHRNSQASVPFALSSLRYGLLRNNPGIGRAVLGKKIMSFEAYSTKALDYWVVAGATPAEIEEAYARATGTMPMMPEYRLGFWRYKPRCQTQEELLGIAREYRARKLPLVCQAGLRESETTGSSVDEMIKELQELRIELMVSIWPTVDARFENNQEMLENGYPVRTDRGNRIGMDFEGNTFHYEAINPGARSFLREKARQSYYSKSFKVFWLDEAEPECSAYDFDNYRYHLGPDVAVGSIYPRDYARTFYDGMEAPGQKNIVNLLRCA